MPDDGPPLTLDQVRAAAAVGRLPELANQLVTDHRWSSLEVLLTMAATPSIPLDDVTNALQALVDALAMLAEADRKEAARELREAELHAATALARRCDVQPLTERQRRGLRAAAGLFGALSETRRAAELFEKAGDDSRAAEAWGATGDLDRMEACLAREEQRRTDRLHLVDLRRRFELLSSAGDRLAAVNAAAGIAPADLDSQDLLLRARETETRLRRGRAVSLRLADGRTLRVAALPAVLGRDPTVELPLREPTVSRRHARLSLREGEIILEDAGSRAGTLLAGLRVAGQVPLHGEGQLQLGHSCRLQFRGQPPRSLLIEGLEGLDRGQLALVGPDPVELAPLLGLSSPLRVSFASGVARLQRPAGPSFRSGGQLVGPQLDLLHAEVVQCEDGLRLEVL